MSSITQFIIIKYRSSKVPHGIPEKSRVCDYQLSKSSEPEGRNGYKKEMRNMKRQSDVMFCSF